MDKDTQDFLREAFGGKLLAFSLTLARIFFVVWIFYAVNELERRYQYYGTPVDPLIYAFAVIVFFAILFASVIGMPIMVCICKRLLFCAVRMIVKNKAVRLTAACVFLNIVVIFVVLSHEVGEVSIAPLRGMQL